MSNTRVPQARITGLFGALAKGYSKKRLGRVPEALGIYWHNRPVLKASMGIGAKAEKWDRCDRSLKTFAHMAVAAQIGCSWCLDYAYFAAFNEKLDLFLMRIVDIQLGGIRRRLSDRRVTLEFSEAAKDFLAAWHMADSSRPELAEMRALAR